MKNKLKMLIAALMITVGLTTVLVPQVVFADLKADACAGVAATGVSCTGGDSGFEKIVKTVVNILSVIVGSVCVIMIIIGGFRYVISNGDSNSLSGAKNTILYAIVGLVIVLFAQVIVQFVYTAVVD